MDDGRDDQPFDEGFDDEPVEEPRRPRRAPSEGVRILGAEEAQAALEHGAEGHDAPGTGRELRAGDVEPSASFPRPSGAGPLESQGATWSASGDQDRPEPSEPVDLPHWTEPPTGQSPQVLPDRGPVGEDDDDAWRHVSGSTPRFREQPGDWDEVDFAEELTDQTAAVGPIGDNARVDEDAVFAHEVAKRRRPTARPGRRRPQGSRPAPSDTEGRDLPTALATAGVIAVVAIICLLIGRGAVAWFATAIVAVASAELFGAFRRNGYQPAVILGIIGSAAMPVVAYERGDAAFPLVIALVVGFTFFWYLAEVVRGEPTVNMSVTVFGFAYVGLLGGFAGLILTHPDGIGLIWGLALCAIAYDVAAFFVGGAVGKTPLLERISPNKTIEGLAAGMAASILVGIIIAGRISPWDTGSGLALGVAIAIAAPLGDLCESLLKRDLDVKDLGSLLPGHGGVIDRFDAILFCLPVVYYLALGLDL
ncbi:MAG: phosphatidate cytidylyltransferase [Acidimicrobiia bacterium]